MTQAPQTAPLVTNLELRLAYCPAEGRLYRTDPSGRPGRELSLWHAREPAFDNSDVWLPGIGYRRANRVIFYMMAGRWPAPGLVVNHIDHDVTNNKWQNLRECTVAEALRN
jgi:hypothetical protein